MTRTIFQLDQMNLGLPSRDYYLKPSSESDYLAAYHKYMTEVAVLLGADRNSAANELSDVIEFEKKLANVSTLKINLCGFSGTNVYNFTRKIWKFS